MIKRWLPYVRKAVTAGVSAAVTAYLVGWGNGVSPGDRNLIGGAILAGVLAAAATFGIKQLPGRPAKPVKPVKFGR